MGGGSWRGCASRSMSTGANGSDAEYQEIGAPEWFQSGVAMSPGCGKAAQQHLTFVPPPPTWRGSRTGTFICPAAREDAVRPTTGKSRAKMKQKLLKAVRRARWRAETMFVVPYCMGPFELRRWPASAWNWPTRPTCGQHAHHGAGGNKAMEALDGREFVKDCIRWERHGGERGRTRPWPNNSEEK